LNRSLVLLCQIVLLMCPSTLLAQRGGHSAGHPATGASNPTPNTSDISDFNRAIALQATPDQIAQFQQLNKSTEAASKEAQNLIQHPENQPPENATRPNSSRYTDLSNSLDEAQTNIQHFVSSFSTAQQSGLKPQIKKLSKADSDVSKQSKTLAQELERSQIDDKKLAAVAEKLNKTLTGFRAELIDLGKEMGIQPEEHSP
jgi:murein L,D-transpeptidase YcbB/YkuD